MYLHTSKLMSIFTRSVFYILSGDTSLSVDTTKGWVWIIFSHIRVNVVEILSLILCLVNTTLSIFRINKLRIYPSFFQLHIRNKIRIEIPPSEVNNIWWQIQLLNYPILLEGLFTFPPKLAHPHVDSSCYTSHCVSLTKLIQRLWFLMIFLPAEDSCMVIPCDAIEPQYLLHNIYISNILRLFKIFN